MDASDEKVFIRCEKQCIMLNGRVLIPGNVMEIPKDMLEEIQHIISAKVVTVHSRNPDAVRSARKDAVRSAREERVNPPSNPSVTDYSGFKKSELLVIAKENGISVKNNENKASIIEKLSQGG